MRRVAPVVLALLVALVVARDAGACSCVGPMHVVITPERADDVPLNTRVRLLAPTAAHGGRSVPMVLRAHGTDVAVPSRTRSTAYGSVDILEIEPLAALAPATQYEIASVDPSAHPPVWVYGTFKTGASADTTAPKLEALRGVTLKMNAHPGGGSCGVPGPWGVIEGLRASDPGRPDAQLAVALWVGDASGRVDDTKPYVGLEKIGEGRGLTLGPTSLCDPRTFPFPKGGGPMWLGLAVVDEAGNRSPTRRVRVDPAVVTP